MKTLQNKLWMMVFVTITFLAALAVTVPKQAFLNAASDNSTSAKSSPQSTGGGQDSAKSAPWPLSGDPNIFANLAEDVVPSVVNIQILSDGPKGRRGQQMVGPEEFFRRFFEGQEGNGMRLGPFGRPMQQQAPRRQMTSLGTGFIIDASGIILTNQHVVNDADEIRVQFTEDPSEKPTEGKVIGRDNELDVALIQVKTDRKLKALSLGDSDGMRVGEYVMAVGNPFGQGHSVTHGIISAKNRLNPELPLAGYLQTDAPINPGNSGGPLLNLRGEVIGINNAIDQRAQNIGFAIPINMVKGILPQLRNDGKVTRGYLGVKIEPLRPEIANQLSLPKDLEAPIVIQADPGDPAFKAGIRPYDVITAVNGKRIKTPTQLMTEVASAPVGDKLKVEALREGQKKTFEVRLAKRPSSNDER